MSKTISLADARAQVGVLAAWSLDEAAMRLNWQHKFASFLAALGFVNAVAELAEAENHHPDFALHFRELSLVLWSHDAGGLTARDFALAAKIQELFETRKAW